MKLPINSVIVAEDRHRKKFDPDYINSLSQSIEEVGLIHPIVVEKETSLLIAGECRLRACKQLGWEDIEVTFKEDLDPFSIQLMELEENIKRRDLPWQDEVDAKLRLHELYQSKYGGTVEGRKGGHRLVDTAEVLGEAEGLTKMDVALAKAVRDNPDIAKAETKSQAYKMVKQKEEFNLRSAIATILANDVAPTEERVSVILGDALEVLKGYPDECFDFCVTDPPYGVNVNVSTNLEEGWMDVRVDDTRGMTLQPIFAELFRVLADGAHCYVFFASILQHETELMLTSCGFVVRKIPLVWYKTRSGNIDANHRFTSTYEPIFFCHKGKPKTFNLPGLEDVFNIPTPSLKRHPTEKPTSLVGWLIENASVENEMGVDPFAGSGTFGVACRTLNRRAVLVEKDKEYFTLAWERVHNENVES